MNKNVITTIAVGAAGLLAGLGVGYTVGKARTAKAYEAIIDKELEELKNHYKRPVVFKTDEPDSETPIFDEMLAEKDVTDRVLEATAETKIEDIDGSLNQENRAIIDSQDYKTHGDSLAERDVTQTHNIFVDGVPLNPDEHDGNALVPNGDKPYVISHMLYHEHDPNYEKVTVMYYEADDTLAADDDSIIDDIELNIGSDALAHFGDMSNDKDIVYVRNEQRMMDFEVCRDNNSYAAAVAGILPPKEPRNARMREDDGQ